MRRHLATRTEGNNLNGRYRQYFGGLKAPSSRPGKEDAEKN